MVKAHLEMKLIRTVGNNKKSFCKCTNGKRQCKNNIGPLQNEDRHLTDNDKDKAEVFNIFFASVFNTGDRPRGSHCPELENHDDKKDNLPVDPELVQYFQLTLNLQNIVLYLLEFSCIPKIHEA